MEIFPRHTLYSEAGHEWGQRQRVSGQKGRFETRQLNHLVGQPFPKLTVSKARNQRLDADFKDANKILTLIGPSAGMGDSNSSIQEEYMLGRSFRESARYLGIFAGQKYVY